MSSSSLDEVKITIGRSLVRSSARSLLSTESPSSFGNFRSSKTSWGIDLFTWFVCESVPKKYSSAYTPSRTTTTSLTMLLLLRARRVNISSRALSSTSKITLCLISNLPEIWKREVEGRSLIHRTFSPNMAPVSINDALNSRQSDSRAFELGRGMETLEGAKQSIDIGHVKPGSVVADEIRRLTVIHVTTKNDSWFLLF